MSGHTLSECIHYVIFLYRVCTIAHPGGELIMVTAPHQEEHLDLFSQINDMSEEEIGDAKEEIEKISEVEEERAEKSAEQDEIEALVTRALQGDQNAFGV